MRISFILLFLAASFSSLVTDAIIVNQENSLYGPYLAGGNNLASWDLLANAQPGGSVIRLTPDEPGKQGAIWNKYPILGNDWEAHMHFHIHGKGNREYGDGMAMWYVKDRLQTGPIFGSKDYFTGLGVFIDTYDNPEKPHGHGHPFISAVVNNGTIPYSHDEGGTDYQIGGCHLPLRNLHWPTKIAVSYISSVLTIFVDAHGQNIWSECLRAPGVHLPTGYFLGISASTGTSRSDNHDVISITSLDQLVPGKQWVDRSGIIPHAEFIDTPDYLDVEPPEEAENIIQEIKIPIVPTDQKIPPKIEVRFETPPPKKAAFKYEVKVHNTPEVLHEPQKRDVHAEKKPEPKKPEVHEPQKPDAPEPKKVQPESGKKKPATLLTKLIYLAVIGVILFVGTKLFLRYRADRRERMQKRLY